MCTETKPKLKLSLLRMTSSFPCTVTDGEDDGTERAAWVPGEEYDGQYWCHGSTGVDKAGQRRYTRALARGRRVELKATGKALAVGETLVVGGRCHRRTLVERAVAGDLGQANVGPGGEGLGGGTRKQSSEDGEGGKETHGGGNKECEGGKECGGRSVKVNEKSSNESMAGGRRFYMFSDLRPPCSGTTGHFTTLLGARR